MFTCSQGLHHQMIQRRGKWTSEALQLQRVACPLAVQERVISTREDQEINFGHVQLQPGQIHIVQLWIHLHRQHSQLQATCPSAELLQHPMLLHHPSRTWDVAAPLQRGKTCPPVAAAGHETAIGAEALRVCGGVICSKIEWMLV